MSEQAKAEAEVRQAFLAAHNAWNAGDADTLVAAWHPEASTYMWDGGVLALNETFDYQQGGEK